MIEGGDGSRVSEPGGTRLHDVYLMVMGKIDGEGISFIQERNRQSVMAAGLPTGDMMTSAVQTKDISSTLHLSLNVVKERYHVDNLALFGSRARGVGHRGIVFKDCYDEAKREPTRVFFIIGTAPFQFRSPGTLLAMK